MKTKHFVLVFCLLFQLLSVANANSLSPLNICYVSMNADTEQPFLASFVGLFKDELEAQGYKAEVIELLKVPGKPLAAIQAAIDAGIQCDGLVLSGHFCGSFHGSRLRGAYVTLPMIEKLSCQPKNIAWFGRIRALWMQGCRSLGVGNSSFCPAPERQAEQNLPDTAEGYADRALGHADSLVNEGFSADFRNLYSGYSESVGSKNPPGDRYLRIFPSANVFGWTATSPSYGESEVSIPHHFSQTILNDPEVRAEDKATLFSAKNLYLKREFEMSAQNKKLYAQAYINLLSGKQPQDLCRAWNGHVVARKPGPYNLSRWDFCPSSTPSMSYLSQSSGDAKKSLENFRIAKELNCKMATAKTPEDWKAILTAKEFDEQIAPLVFPMLWESLNPPPGTKNNPAPAPANVRAEDLKASTVLMNYMEARIRDPKMPAISKLDWYFYMRDKLQVPNPNLAEIVASDAQAFVDLGLPNKLPGRATIALEGLHRDMRKKIEILKSAELTGTPLIRKALRVEN